MSVGNGILTVFPFADFFLRVRLGSTYPQQINFTVEPWPLRRWGNEWRSEDILFIIVENRP